VEIILEHPGQVVSGKSGVGRLNIDFIARFQNTKGKEGENAKSGACFTAIFVLTPIRSRDYHFS